MAFNKQLSPSPLSSSTTKNGYNAEIKGNDLVRETNIVDLNDHCLSNIFEFLDSEDLYNLHKIHKRFNTAIGDVFAHGKVEFWIDDESFEPQWESFLKEFTELTNSVCIYFEEHDVEEFFKKYRMSNIRKCIFENIKVSSELVQNNQHFFAQLKWLMLSYNAIENESFQMILNNINQINVLKISDNIGYIENISSVIATITSYPLKSLRLHTTPNSTLNQEEIDKLPVNTSVKELFIDGKDIGLLKHFRGVEKLYLLYKSLIVYTTPIEVENLKDLELNFEGITQTGDLELILSDLVKRYSNTLEKFELRLPFHNFNVDMKVVGDYIRKLSNLKDLWLSSKDSFRLSMLDFAQDLEQLENFYMFGYHKHFLDIGDFRSTLCAFVSFATNLRHIYLLAPTSTTEQFFQDLYNDLARLRKICGNNRQLLVTIVEDEKYRKHRIDTNNLITMEIL